MTFKANMTSAMISIPIVADLDSTEDTECFLVHLSVLSIVSDPNGTAVSIGGIREATVCIRDEIIISFPGESVQAVEGGTMILTVSANTASDQDYGITVNITGSRDHNMSCELMYVAYHNDRIIL